MYEDFPLSQVYATKITCIVRIIIIILSSALILILKSNLWLIKEHTFLLILLIIDNMQLKLV